MSGKVFLDTNVLIYAATGREAHPPKFRRAREIVASADVGISTQVIGEFVDNVVVSTQRIGCGTAQSSLPAPTNLRILN